MWWVVRLAPLPVPSDSPQGQWPITVAVSVSSGQGRQQSRSHCLRSGRVQLSRETRSTVGLVPSRQYIMLSLGTALGSRTRHASATTSSRSPGGCGSLGGLLRGSTGRNASGLPDIFNACRLIRRRFESSGITRRRHSHYRTQTAVYESLVRDY